MADTVTTTNSDENLSNVPILNATPGEINDISEALTQELVDYTSESWVSVQSRVANAALTKNVLQNYGPMVATVLKIIPATTPDPREVKRAAKFDYTPVPLLRIVARVDLMHAHPQFGILPQRKHPDQRPACSHPDGHRHRGDAAADSAFLQGTAGYEFRLRPVFVAWHQLHLHALRTDGDALGDYR